MKRQSLILALTALAVVTLISVVLMIASPAHAGRAMQISGTGQFAGPECADFPGETGPGLFYEFALKFEGDLNGCHYVHIMSSECSPSGTYRERGTEIFVGEYGGAYGTFETTYLFTAKFSECDVETGIPGGVEIWGRCQHPIIAGSGSPESVFDGVTGRIDVKDDIAADGEVTFRYRGHLRW